MTPLEAGLVAGVVSALATQLAMATGRAWWRRRRCRPDRCLCMRPGTAPVTTPVVRHLYHRHGAVWCGLSLGGVFYTTYRPEANCPDCIEIAARFAGANPACPCQECRR